MTKRNSIPPMTKEVAEWRRALHQNPGLMYEETFANALVIEKLTEMGIPFKAGLGKTGIVAIIEGKTNTSGRTIGLRADMDALPIFEASGQPWASKIPGLMHACGHDGHTSILLGTAKYLWETRNFDGRVLLIFQPAEEGGRGAFAMIKDGLFAGDLKCDAVYALHNWPYQPVGTAAIKPGPIMASVDDFDIVITGKGGHAAYPARCIDPIVIGAQVTMALQTIISRMVPAQDSAILSITNFNAGTGAHNVIPDTGRISGTVRTFKEDVRVLIEAKMKKICTDIGVANDATIVCDYQRNIDPTINDPAHTVIAADAMARILGEENVDRAVEPTMGGEDFGGMLAAVPGAYIFMGQGTNDPKSPHNQGLHNPGYDFNDEALAIGMDYFAELVESGLPLKNPK